MNTITLAEVVSLSDCSTLFVDTETTGLWDWRADLDAPHQPHICQLAFELVNTDGRPVASFAALIQPQGWTIPPAASAVHGLTVDHCAYYGQPVERAMATLVSYAKRAGIVVAHNWDFDGRLLARESTLWRAVDLPAFCTMRAATPLCKLPGKRAGDYKFPKLAEALKLLCGVTHTDAHDALADVRGCRRLYRELLRLEAATPTKDTTQ